MAGLISWHTVTTLWIAWLLYWAISAWGVRRNERGESSSQRFLTALVLGCGGYLIFARSSGLGPLDRRFVPDDPAIKAAAMVLLVAGLGISIWARRHIGQFWSGRVMLKENHQLIQSGPYARVRHPIYSGLLLAMIGTALFVGESRAALGVLVIFAGHGWKARREEALLAGQFGASYEEYRRRTGSLLPRL
ncbi:MAG: isoprenylcysteine carboxylmethyltransferase family protein [Terriglobales bacterium]